MHALVNATIHTGDRVLTDSALLLDEGRIAAVLPVGALPGDATARDLGGGILAPGFIDAQVNGGGGVLFNDSPDVESICRIAEAHRRFGTTGLLPTFITDTRPKRRAALEAVRAARAAGVPGILGVHLEGPHLNRERRGVHEARFIVPPEEEDLAMTTGPGLGTVLVTLAPETVPASAIRDLVARGVRVSAGHTAARWAEIRAALDAGVVGFTHLFNAMSPLDHREPGAVGAALEDEGSWCGIIVDGHHVHDAAVRLAWKAKPRGKLFLVTDAMPPVGAPPGDFTLYGETVTVRDGRCVSADGRLAGSALDMATALRNCVERVGIPLDEALRMASAYPADFLGIAGERGRIAPGLAADLVHLDEGLRPLGTWIGGIFKAC